MIFRRLWNAMAAQFNKVAHAVWSADPIAQLQLEHDRAVEQLQEGREGLVQYRTMVKKVERQVENSQKDVSRLTARIKAHLKAGNRELAAELALNLQQAKARLAEVTEQHGMHEATYGNNLKRIKQATQRIRDLQQKIRKFDAEMKMSRVTAELSKLSESFDGDVTSDIGQIEDMIQDEIDTNRARSQVASDMAAEKAAEIEAEELIQKSEAEDALAAFEEELGLRTPATTNVQEEVKELGPEEEEEETETA
jgi:phage shock protein A